MLRWKQVLGALNALSPALPDDVEVLVVVDDRDIPIRRVEVGTTPEGALCCWIVTEDVKES